MRWTGAGRLEIAYPPHARIFKQATRIADVEISYRVEDRR